MLLSILAGLSIGIACIFYILSPSPIIGAALFGLGLLNIRLMGYKLFTGKVQTVLSGETIGNLLVMLGLNMVGVFIACGIGSLIPGVMAGATAIATAKLSLGLFQILGQSILCGYLMTTATRPSTPMWMTPLCVFAFVILGLNHCVADTFYYSTMPLAAIGHFLVTVVGNFIGGVIAAIKPADKC